MAQQASVSAGGNANGTTGSLSYSIGQVAYTNQVGSNGSVNQGVQQAFEIFTLGTDEFPEIKLTMTLYPNPTASKINLLIPNYASERISWQLIDTNGRIIQSQEIMQNETQISMENLASAVYLLQVSAENKLLKTFKIIKK